MQQAQYEKMQQAQGQQQQAVQQPAAEKPDGMQLMQAAMAQGYTQQQAQQYAQQYMQQWQLQQQQQPQQSSSSSGAAAADASAAVDSQQLIATALAQGYSQEQAQQYADQYMAALLVQQSGGASASAGPPKEERVARFASTPLILNVEDERASGQFRATLKAILMGEGGKGKRTFQDIFIRGPWRRQRIEALKDQGELSSEFKFEGKPGAERKGRELGSKTWTPQELEGLMQEQRQKESDAAAAEEDDFDAEAESDAEPEPEVGYHKEELPVRIRGVEKPDGPIQTWDEGVSRGCVAPMAQQALHEMKMHRPTLIQRFALPLIANSSRDLLAQAQTGSGKTMAFVIPIVSRLLMSPPVDRPFFPGAMSQASPVALLLSPTRELAIQTAKHVSDLLHHAGSKMTTLTLYGGETLKQQIKPIETKNMDIICATPGRLLDAIDAGKVSLSFALVVVLDEADQMLDLSVGLEGTVMQITDGRDLPRSDGRQTLLFSATMPDFQTKQFHSVLKAPPLRAKLRVGHYAEDEKGGSCRHIRQLLTQVSDMDDRWERLGRDLLETWGSTKPRREGKGIIFTN
ncbi:unnamed protein product, partial [Polarella glacialis]